MHHFCNFNLRKPDKIKNMYKQGLFSSLIKDARRVGLLMGGVKGAWLTFAALRAVGWIQVVVTMTLVLFCPLQLGAEQ